MPDEDIQTPEPSPEPTPAPSNVPPPPPPSSDIGTATHGEGPTEFFDITYDHAIKRG